ncbi:MAG: proline/glycine betaine ABC transporter permease, partial [Halocynthiibacter sp.]
MDFLTEFPEMGRTDLRDLKKGIDETFRAFTRAYGDDIENFFNPLLKFLVWFEKLLIATPWPIMIAIVAVLVWLGGRSKFLVVGTIITMILIG